MSTSATPQAVPEGTLLLHIGPQKTGSTAIQVSLHEARQELADQGVSYPGKDMRPREPGWAVLGGSAIGRGVPDIAVWDAFVAEVKASTGTRVCVSNEDFGRADEAVVERILNDLGTENLHLVFVARRLDKLLPSHWAERVKARMTLSYDEFLHHVLDTPDIDWEARVTWEPHDIGLVLGRWSAHLRPDQITVIVSDETDRTLIPSTFEGLLGLSPGTLKPPRSNSNTSLSYTQTEAVRRVNQLSKDLEWSPEEYWRIIQTGVVKELRAAGDSTDGPRILGLPSWAYPLVADRAEAQVAAIAASGVRVVGDPENLLLRGRVEPAELPAPITSVPLDLVTAVVKGAAEGSQRLHRAELRTARRARPKKTSVDDLSGRYLMKVLARRLARKLH